MNATVKLVKGRHGRIYTYLHHKCKCLECRGAWSDYQYNRRRRVHDLTDEVPS